MLILFVFFLTELQDMFVLKNENHDNLLTASILQQFHTAAKPALKAGFVDSPVSNLVSNR